CESKRALPHSAEENQEDILKKHFNGREEKERFYFKEDNEFHITKDRVLYVPYGESNSQDTFQYVQGLHPHLIILYGCSIIKPPLLEYYDNRIINMHLGLSPFYRGAGTNFWPLVNGEPECVGATIHLAILRVDAGAMLGQVRPPMTAKDDNHDIGCKTIIAGTEMMIKCIPLYHDKKIDPLPQKSGGKLYKNKDFNAEAVQKMWNNLQEGMIRKYLAEKEKRDKKYPIVER
ncbi:MAG: hypothetical protein JW827_05585, partial [Spirochaetes bacterium]|nr:hypothetical protein [Spirochaetota bacterium]